MGWYCRLQGLQARHNKRCSTILWLEHFTSRNKDTFILNVTKFRGISALSECLSFLFFLDCGRESSSKFIQVSLNVWSFFRTSSTKQTKSHLLQVDICLMAVSKFSRKSLFRWNHKFSFVKCNQMLCLLHLKLHLPQLWL